MTRAERARRSEEYRAWVAAGGVGPRPARFNEVPALAVARPVPPAIVAPRARAVTTDAPQLVAIASDIHWRSEAPSWRAFRRWHATVRPHRTILLGDLIDAAMVSRHDPHKDDPATILEELEALVDQCNALAAECGELTLCIGNHDKRVEAYLRGPRPQVTKGLRGITLPELAREHGLDARVKWFEETAERPWLPLAQFHLQHGHNSSGRFGAGMHPAAMSVTKSNGHSVLRGHLHRGQVYARTAFGRTAIGIANPCMVKPMGYAPNADWQQGFSALLLRPPTFDYATPFVVFCDDEGGFCWGDRYYSGAE